MLEGWPLAGQTSFSFCLSAEAVTSATVALAVAAANSLAGSLAIWRRSGRPDKLNTLGGLPFIIGGGGRAGFWFDFVNELCPLSGRAGCRRASEAARRSTRPVEQKLMNSWPAGRANNQSRGRARLSRLARLTQWKRRPVVA